MKKFIAAACAATLVLTSLGATLAPAQAAMYSNHNNPPPRFEQHGSYAMYNGHRGYRVRHPGYREYNGYWFPPSAFVGAVIGGILGGIVRNSH